MFIRSNQESKYSSIELNNNNNQNNQDAVKETKSGTSAITNNKYLSGNSTNQSSSKNIQKLSKITNQAQLQGISLKANPFYRQGYSQSTNNPISKNIKITKNLF